VPRRRFGTQLFRRFAQHREGPIARLAKLGIGGERDAGFEHG